MNKSYFDVVIIGGGAAGISAALWCDELGLTSILLESNSELGGQLLWTHNPIKNYLGVEAKNGKELAEIFKKQISKRNFVLQLNTKVKNIDFTARQVQTKGNNFFYKNLIIATGTSRRKLHIPGENKFKNNGILISGTLSQKLIKDRVALIVGGGDSALENAKILAKDARKIFLIHRNENFSGRKEFVLEALNNPNIDVMRNFIVKKINGDKRVESVLVENTVDSSC